MTAQEELITIMQEHVAVVTPEGWVDCSCGWESNHPLLPSADEQAMLDDPDSPDPTDRTGDVDPEHTGLREAWLAHVAALQAAVPADG